MISSGSLDMRHKIQTIRNTPSVSWTIARLTQMLLQTWLVLLLFFLWRLTFHLFYGKCREKKKHSIALHAWIFNEFAKWRRRKQQQSIENKLLIDCSLAFCQYKCLAPFFCCRQTNILQMPFRFHFSMDLSDFIIAWHLVWKLCAFV